MRRASEKDAVLDVVGPSNETRRSRDNMTEVKKKKIEKLKSQKQFSSKGANLGLYKGQKGKNTPSDENIPPSDSFLCSQTSNMSVNK